MSKTKFISITSCLAVAGLFTGPVRGQDAAPKITAEQPTFDFGETWSGTKIKHTFIVKNEGTAVLTITKVKPGCGCTVTQTYDRNIEPGQTGRIPLELSAKSSRDTKKTVKVRVESNDPANPTYELVITGKVKQRFRVDPPRGSAFGRVRPHENKETRLTLTNQMEQPVELSIKSSKINVFNAELITKEPGKVYELVIKTNPPYREKDNRGTLKIQTNLGDKSTVDIPLSLFALPLVEVRPEELVISKAEDTARSQTVRVSFNAAEPRQILSAKTDAGNDVKVEVKEVATSAFDVALTFPPKYMPPAKGHKLTLKTDDPKNPEVTVKIAQKTTPKRRPKPALTLAGKPIPDATFTLASDGSSIKTSEIKEDATVLMFYASWCGFCKKALPKLEEMQKNYEGKPFRVMAVSMDTIVDAPDPKNRRGRTKEQVVAQWQELGVSLPQALDSNLDGRKKFKVQSFPTMFLVSSKTGKVERAYVGGGAVNDGSLKSDIETLLAGKTLPPQKVEAVAEKPKPKRPALDLAGKPAPQGSFTLASDGSTVNLNSSDEVTVAFFYASWCGFCKKALPKLNDMHKEYSTAGKPVRFVGISEDTIVDAPDPKNRRGRTKEQVVGQWRDFGISFPQALDLKRVGQSQFKVRSFPTMFLLDRKGKVDKAYVGGGAVNSGQLKKDIEALIKG